MLESSITREESLNMQLLEHIKCFKCEQCGNCCNIDIIHITVEDILRISQYLNKPVKTIHKKYIIQHPLHPSHPCQDLGADSGFNLKVGEMGRQVSSALLGLLAGVDSSRLPLWFYCTSHERIHPVRVLGWFWMGSW